MHIPDGMLSTTTVATAGAGSAGFIAYAVAWVRKNLDQQRIVLMAVIASLVFALQMLNFPVAGGTSGHFAGGAAAAILLGPWPAVIVLTTVLLVQAVFFADGGIIALGANVLNLAVIAPFVGYAIYRAVTAVADSRAVRVGAAFFSAWIATIVAAMAAGLEIWLSGNANFAIVVSAMGIWHALIGLGEGLITAGLVAYVLNARPDLMERTSAAEVRDIRGVAVTLATVAFVAAGLSFLASGSPDGLEFVYFEEGIGVAFEEVSLINSPIPDYAVPGITNETLAGILAGVAGVIITGILLYTLALSVRRRNTGDSA